MIFWSAIGLIAVVGLLSQLESSKEPDAAVEACVERGRAYFTPVGSFPKLSDGREAMQVAREACEPTPFTAF